MLKDNTAREAGPWSRGPQRLCVPLVVASVLFVAACGSASPTSPSGSNGGSPSAIANSSVAAQSSPRAASPSSAATTPSSPTANGAAKTPLGISYSAISGSYLPVWFAQDSGIFNKNGIDARLKYVAGAPSIAALMADDLQVILVSGSDALSAAAEGADLAVLATIVPRYQFVLEVKPSIKTPQELKGKKLAVTSLGASTDIALRLALRKIGLDPEKDVSIVALGNSESSRAALLNGAVDGTMVSPGPDSIKLQSAGFQQLVDLMSLGLPAANQTVTVRRTQIAQDRALTQRFMDSMVQSITLLKKDKPQALKVLGKWLKSEDETSNSVIYEASAAIFENLPYARKDQFVDAQEELGKKSAKVREYDLDRLMDSSFVDSAAQRGLDR